MDNRNDNILLSIAGTRIPINQDDAHALEKDLSLTEVVKRSDAAFSDVRRKLSQMRSSPELFEFSRQVNQIERSLNKTQQLKSDEDDSFRPC